MDRERDVTLMESELKIVVEALHHFWIHRIVTDGRDADTTRAAHKLWLHVREDILGIRS